MDNDRCWKIEWNPAFFRFCLASGGNLLFDLDLYRTLTPASRRLFLKLKDRFWRAKRVFLNVDDLTIQGLGFSADRSLAKRKFDLTNCLQELLRHHVIGLGRGQSDVRDLFMKRGKWAYVVVLHEGAYFRQPSTNRTTSEKKSIANDPLFEPLRKIGVDEAGIQRLFRECARSLISRWVKIADAAMHEGPRDSLPQATNLLSSLILQSFPRLGERQIRNYQAEQPDANAWRLILLAAGR